ARPSRVAGRPRQEASSGGFGRHWRWLGKVTQSPSQDEACPLSRVVLVKSPVRRRPLCSVSPRLWERQSNKGPGVQSSLNGPQQEVLVLCVWSESACARERPKNGFLHDRQPENTGACVVKSSTLPIGTILTQKSFNRKLCKRQRPLPGLMIRCSSPCLQKHSGSWRIFVQRSQSVLPGRSLPVCRRRSSNPNVLHTCTVSLQTSLGSISPAGEIESLQIGFRKTDPSSPSRTAHSVPVPSTHTLTFVRSTRSLWRDARSSFGLTGMATSFPREPKERPSNMS